MMEMKDWISGFIGLLIAALGALPLLSLAGIGPDWFAIEFLPVQLFAYVLAGAGFYLAINSIIEITNSNSIGWLSFLVAAIVLIVGMMQLLFRFNIAVPDWFALDFISPVFYYILFLLEGLLLMMAMFAMVL